MVKLFSADADTLQLQEDPPFLTPPGRVVKRRSFRCIPCCNGVGCLVSHYNLIKLAKEALAPHPTRSPAKTGKISEILNGTIRVMRSLVNFILDWILSAKICYIMADYCRRNVQAHLMMRLHGMLLQSTLN
jgi:hypothetical protein